MFDRICVFNHAFNFILNYENQYFFTFYPYLNFIKIIYKINIYSLLIVFNFLMDILDNQPRRQRGKRENNFSSKQYAGNKIRKSSLLEKVGIFMIFSFYESCQIIFLFKCIIIIIYLSILLFIQVLQFHFLKLPCNFSE